MKNGRIAVIMCILLAIAVVFSGCDKAEFGQVVATVNDEKVTVRDFKYILSSMKSQTEKNAQQNNAQNIWETPAEDGKTMAEMVKEKAYDETVMTVIKNQKAKTMGITLSDQDKQSIVDQKKQFIEGLGGRDNYEKGLREKGFTDKTFTAFLETLVLAGKVDEKIQKEDIPKDITDQEIADYFAKNKEEFKQVKAKHILLSTVDDNKQPLPADKQAEAKTKADEVYAKIKAGEDFDTLMNQYSQDPGLQSSPDGYTFGKGQMVPEFEKAAFAMQPGQVSEIVKTDFGYHIIKLVEIVEPKIDEQKETIKSKIEETKYNDLMKKWKEDTKIVKNDKILNPIKVQDLK